MAYNDSVTGESTTGSTARETEDRKAQAKKEGDYAALPERVDAATKGIATRTGVGQVSKQLTETEPQRKDYPPGLAGTAAWNQARNKFRAPKSAAPEKSPTPVPTPSKKTSRLNGRKDSYRA